MTDIVERLRKAGLRDGFAVILYQHVQQAAVEIERLRHENKRLHQDVELWKCRVNEGADIIEGNVAIIDELRAANKRLT